jgi:hypothetical protein
MGPIEPIFSVGNVVDTRRGYDFPGTVVSAFRKLDGQRRYVVEHETSRGLLHIFGGRDLKLRRPDHLEALPAAQGADRTTAVQVHG